jgi:hypothetical protein
LGRDVSTLEADVQSLSPYAHVMAGGDIGRTQSERSAGTTAARELWQNWPDYEDVHDPLSPTFAEAALSELERLQRTMPGVLAELVRYAESGAEQLVPDPYHGILEVVQNTDDLGATEVRVAIRATPWLQSRTA